MNLPKLQVLYEDNHLLAVNKPAGLATMGTPTGKPSLLEVAKDYIKHRYNKPGNVYLGVVSRLDAPVTGVLLFARTSKAARRLNEQFRSRVVDKVYRALVEGKMHPPSGRLVDWVGHDERHRRMHIVGPTLAGAREARLTYETVEMLRDATQLEVRLETGRKHQIRLQLALAGFPIIGDRKYGSRRPFSKGVALHSLRVVLDHPVKGSPLTIEAPLPPSWRKLGANE